MYGIEVDDTQLFKIADKFVAYDNRVTKSTTKGCFAMVMLNGRFDANIVFGSNANIC